MNLLIVLGSMFLGGIIGGLIGDHIGGDYRKYITGGAAIAGGAIGVVTAAGGLFWGPLGAALGLLAVTIVEAIVGSILIFLFVWKMWD